MKTLKTGVTGGANSFGQYSWHCDICGTSSAKSWPNREDAREDYKAHRKQCKKTFKTGDAEMPTKKKAAKKDAPSSEAPATPAPDQLLIQKAKKAKKIVKSKKAAGAERSATDEDTTKAAEQLRAGATLATVSKSLGVTYRSLQKKLKAVLGVEYVSLMVRKGKKHDGQEGAKA